MDPDDIYLNENLFKELYDYNLKYNLDITEFLVLQQKEGNNEIFFPKSKFLLLFVSIHHFLLVTY